MKKNIIISVIMLILVILCEFLIWDKIVVPSEVRDYDLVKAKELVDKFYTDNYIISSNVFKEGMTEKYKISMAFNESNKVKEYECSEIYKDTTSDSEGIVVGDGTFCDGKVKGLQYADLEKAYKDLFGKEAKLAKRGIGIIDYINDENLFVFLSCRCGGVDLTKYIYDVKDASIKGSDLTINVYYAELEEEEEIDVKKYINENKDKMSIYQMDFVKEGKKFKLLEVKKVNK